jgi:ribosome biogenesis SPOUT family RNA methylase Rps3
MQPSKSTHRQSLIGMVAHDIRQKVQEESLPFHVAATRVLIQWLGYDLDDINFIDDPEINIDAWLNVETGLDIFLSKVRDPNAIGTLNRVYEKVVGKQAKRWYPHL